MTETPSAARRPARPHALVALLVLIVALAACGRSGDGGTVFRLVPAAEALTVRPGQSGELPLALEGAPGLRQGAEMSVAGLPEGVTAEFSENPAHEASRLIVRAGAEAQPGEHELTVRAASEAAERTVTVRLIVRADGGSEGVPGGEEPEATEPIANDTPPPEPEGVRFIDKRETKHDVRWRSSPSAERYTVFRRIEQVALPAEGQFGLRFEAAFEGPMSPSPFLWQEIGTLTLEEQSHGSWPTYLRVTDDDLPPLEDRRLGMPYCYTVRAENEAGSADSSEICTRMRGLNPPHSFRVVSRTDSSLAFRWRDTSLLEDGYRMRIYRGADRTKSLAANRESGGFSGLAPDTEYCVSVQAVDFWGASQSDSLCTRTRPAPEPEPEEKTFTLNLQRQQVWEGFIPYYGRLPTAGNGNGNVTRVASPNWIPALYFVKPGHSTEQCNDPGAVVVLQPGSELSASQMKQAFGSETPSLPVHFVACAAATGQLYDWIPINVSYTGNL